MLRAAVVAVIDARELLIEIGRRHVRALTRVCYVLTALLLLESAAFILYIQAFSHNTTGGITWTDGVETDGLGNDGPEFPLAALQRLWRRV